MESIHITEKEITHKSIDDNFDETVIKKITKLMTQAKTVKMLEPEKSRIIDLFIDNLEELPNTKSVYLDTRTLTAEVHYKVFPNERIFYIKKTTPEHRSTRIYIKKERN